MSFLAINPEWRARVQSLERQVNYLDGFEMLMGMLYQQRYDGTPLIAPDRKEECIDAIWGLLSQLNETEFDIMVLRFGLLNNRIATTTETARVLNLPLEQARQIEAKALRKLTHRSCRSQLDSYVTFLKQRA